MTRQEVNKLKAFLVTQGEAVNDKQAIQDIVNRIRATDFTGSWHFGNLVFHFSASLKAFLAGNPPKSKLYGYEASEWIYYPRDEEAEKRFEESVYKYKEYKSRDTISSTKFTDIESDITWWTI
jgi:hypothetical protein